MRIAAFGGLGLTALAVAIALASACSSGFAQTPCGEIPLDGCPTDRGGSCEDETCATLYDCVDGRWVLSETCDQAGGGAGGHGGSAAGGTGAAGGCEGVLFDHQGEVSGCTPDLQLPDCPAVAGESCHPCTTGCVDFFMCTADGWQVVGYCDQEGHVVEEQ